ncbi:hypothetical protein ACLMJK_009127 [Lecanora helva]
MAFLFAGKRCVGSTTKIRKATISNWSTRRFQTATAIHQKVPDYAFAFDIDGVLLRSSNPLPRARQALSYLQSRRIPFILLTNGGGKSEAARVEELSQRLEVPLNVDMFVQSHTPFQELVEEEGQYKDKCVLITGGDGDACRKVAEDYGFTNIVTPADLITSFPTLWPFASPDNYEVSARQLLNMELAPKEYAPNDARKYVKVDAIFVFNDPRDWALDTQIILDLLLSHNGYLGSLSPKNNNTNLPNKGFLQDGQPPIYFSNPDLFWAAEYHLPRLGQGGFREALEGVWRAVTGGPDNGVHLEKHMLGKPSQGTFAFAEKRLAAHRKDLLGKGMTKIGMEGLKKVYMVGDNPESDVRGANEFNSPLGSTWHSILVRSGVYSGGWPAYKPQVVVDDVWDAVRWGMSKEDVLID